MILRGRFATSRLAATRLADTRLAGEVAPPEIVSAAIEGGVVTILTSRDCSLSYLAATSAPSTAQDVVDNGTTVLVTGAEAEIADIDDGLDPDDYTLYLVAHDSGSNLSAINSDVEFTVDPASPLVFTNAAQQSGYDDATVTVTLPTNAAGELLLVAIYAANGPVSATGWAVESTGNHHVLSKVSTGSEATVDISRGGVGNIRALAMCVQGTHSAYRVSSIDESALPYYGTPIPAPAQTVAAGGMSIGVWWSTSTSNETASSHTLEVDFDYFKVIVVDDEAGTSATAKTVTYPAGGIVYGICHIGIDP